MSHARSPSKEEKGVLSALLRLKAETLPFIDGLNNLLVQEMSDGGMSGLLLIPKGTETVDRTFGKQIVAGEFTDTDGVPVSALINTDRDNRVYEVDVWEGNFAPLCHWPDPAAIRITE